MFTRILWIFYLVFCALIGLNEKAHSEENGSAIDEIGKPIEVNKPPSAGDSVSVSNAEIPFPFLKGPWQLHPIITGPISDPETGDTLRTIDDAYWLESGILLFWGCEKTAPQSDKKQFSLYSFRDERITKILTENVDFLEPDGIKKKVDRDAALSWTRIIGTRKMVYFQIRHGRADNIYGFDGERMTKIIGKGDTIRIAGSAYAVNSASIRNVDRRDNAEVDIEIEKPARLRWCALHDGSRLNLFYPEGKGLPGMEHLEIEGIQRVFVFPPDTVLALMKLKDVGMGVYRITPGKTDCLLKAGDKDPARPEREITWLGGLFGFFTRIWAGAPDQFMIITGTDKPFTLRESLMQDILFYNNGNWQSMSDALSDFYKTRKIDKTNLGEFFFPSPRRSVVLFDMVYQANPEGFNLMRSEGLNNAGLFMMNDGRIELMPEFDLVHKGSGKEIDVSQYNKYTEFHAMPWDGCVAYKSPRGEFKRYALSSVGFINTNSPEKKVTFSAEFQDVRGAKVQLSDVIAWKSQNEAIIRLKDGFYFIQKQ